MFKGICLGELASGGWGNLGQILARGTRGAAAWTLYIKNNSKNLISEAQLGKYRCICIQIHTRGATRAQPIRAQRGPQGPGPHGPIGYPPGPLGPTSAWHTRAQGADNGPGRANASVFESHRPTADEPHERRKRSRAKRAERA